MEWWSCHSSAEGFGFYPNYPTIEMLRLDGNIESKSLNNTYIFVTPKPDGSMRDVLTVECRKLNKNDFKGTITYSEAREKILSRCYYKSSKC